MKKSIEYKAVQINFDTTYHEHISPEYKSFLDFVVYGKSCVTDNGRYIPTENVNVADYDSIIKIAKIAPKEIIERLTEEHIKKLEDE